MTQEMREWQVRRWDRQRDKVAAKRAAKRALTDRTEGVAGDAVGVGVHSSDVCAQRDWEAARGAAYDRWVEEDWLEIQEG